MRSIFITGIEAWVSFGQSKWILHLKVKMEILSHARTPACAHALCYVSCTVLYIHIISKMEMEMEMEMVLEMEIYSFCN